MGRNSPYRSKIVWPRLLVPVVSTDQSFPTPPLVKLVVRTGNWSAIGGLLVEQSGLESGTLNWTVSPPVMQWPAETRQLASFQTEAVHPTGRSRPDQFSLDGRRLSAPQMPHGKAQPPTAWATMVRDTWSITIRFRFDFGAAISSTMTVSPLK